jgi:hypothetical protein
MAAISTAVALMGGNSIHNFLSMIAGDRVTNQVDMTVTRHQEVEMTGAITIRNSTEADVPAIRDLALLDGGVAPRGDTLLAFVDGELRVAVGRADGRVVADPFRLTADLVTLVRARAGQQQRRHDHGMAGWLSRLAPAIRGEARA